MASATIKPNDGYKAWLDYRPLKAGPVRQAWQTLGSTLAVEIPQPCGASLENELTLALKAMTGIAPQPPEPGTIPGIRIGMAEPTEAKALGTGGFRITHSPSGLDLVAASGPAAVHGAFHLLRQIQLGASPTQTVGTHIPANPLRMIDHWDNMDGSVERGYAGRSIFFKNYKFRKDKASLKRFNDYARLLASLGINAVSINNVNVHQTESFLVTPRYLDDLAMLAGIFRSWGVKLFTSVNYASPITVGNLAVSDPLDPGVRQFWKDLCHELYRHIPDFGGFVVKADSEGRPGPYTYGRNHADGANMLAAALEPHGGLVIWRCFVYNCKQDWRDRSTDRARAAYEHFQPLDGAFAPNVILQIKNGPMDFQVREPVSPLFGGMSRTNQMLELQIAQEYTGQQKHLCFLAPQWKTCLDFPTHAPALAGSTSSSDAPVWTIANGSRYRRPTGGMAAVSNIGDDRNWCGHHLAQANWYAFGRLAWNPCLDSSEIAREWTQLSFGPIKGLETLVDLLTQSWNTYESYTSPLGVGWMINPNHHYGPNVDGYEYDRWGTYHFADCHGMGVDRSLKTGTRYAAQYHSPWREIYEDPKTCPDEVLLFFHHVPYTHRLHSGKTVIQHIYDSHFQGAQAAAAQVETWKSLQAQIDPRRHAEVLARLEDQARHSLEWRDQINTYFWRKSGIPDEKGRTIY